jgi:tetratricopeptide (TPR) repeat protein
MPLDLNGLDVPLAAPEALDLWNRVQRGFLAHAASTGGDLERLLAAEPSFALGHATRGLFLLLLARRELGPAARAALSAAGAGHADARTRQYEYALRAALSGRMRLAAFVLDNVLEVWPNDALAMKLVHGMRFMLGDAGGMLASLESLGPDWGAHPLRGYFLGCRAFALEETGAYAAAEACGRDGLALAPDDAWGLHAVAHVHDMTGRAAEGGRWLATRVGHWAHCNNFGFHVWWHLALFHLDQGDLDAALDLYDRRVRPVPTDDFRDIANAASLLLRLEFEGVTVGGRWDELGELAAGRVEDGALVFADLHYQIALVRAGRLAEAGALATRLARDAGLAEHDQHEVAGASGAPFARGLLLFRDGHYGEALPLLRAGLAGQQRLGGSHAQRDVFRRIAIEAALRGGNMTAAEALLRDRRMARAGTDGYMQRSIARIETYRADLRAAGIAAE